MIKRYANRKLYDTVESRYVTLRDVAAMVRQGLDVAIIDNCSKEDLTRVTLAQIVYESQRSQASGASIGKAGGTRNLKDLIQSGGERLRAHLRESAPGRAPRAGLAALEELQRKADGRMRTLLGTLLPPLRQLQDEVAQLQSRVHELESKLIQMENSKRN